MGEVLTISEPALRLGAFAAVFVLMAAWEAPRRAEPAAGQRGMTFGVAGIDPQAARRLDRMLWNPFLGVGTPPIIGRMRR